MVIATHPDDETLGCGGTLLKHRSLGDRIYWVIATTMAKETGFTEKQIRQRDNEIRRVSRQFDFQKVIQLGFTTTMLDRVPMRDLIDRLGNAISAVMPHTLYLPFSQDVHSDHRMVFQAAYGCAKSFRFPCIRKLLMMETLSETDAAPTGASGAFTPNYHVDITDFLLKKCEILRTYKSEIDAPPFPRSIEAVKALASYRGAGAGCRHAESFMCLREIW